MIAEVVPTLEYVLRPTYEREEEENKPGLTGDSTCHPKDDSEPHLY